MRGTSQYETADLPAAARAAVADARMRAVDWFPELARDSLRVDVGERITRPRCELYRLDLHGGERRRSVMVKIRRSGDLAVRTAARPTLMPAIPESDDEMTRREYEGLRAIAGAYGSMASSCAAARPLALLAEHGAMTMDFVDQPTLRRIVMTGSRPAAGVRGARDLSAVMANVGRWLRIYHGLEPDVVLLPRNAERDMALSQYRDYTGYLSVRTGDEGFFGWLADAAREHATDALPSTFELVVGHGDYVARNVFVAPDDRITVIDPMPRWRVPRHEDLGRFVIGLRLLGVQLVSQGLALPDADLECWEAAFLNGYFGREAVPRRQVDAYQLLILLDKWSSTVGPPTRGPWRRRAVAASRRRWFNRYFRKQATRLVSRLDPAVTTA